MNFAQKLFDKVSHWFTGPKGQDVIHTISELLPVAETIVADINKLAPNKTLAQFQKVAEKYAIPAVQSIDAGQTPGNVALNLATEILRKNHAPAAAEHLLNTVIQLAVTASKV